MPIYFYWGEDDFAIAKAVGHLRQSVVHPDWYQFNYDKLSGAQSDSAIKALNQSMTPPFGFGDRLVWLADTTICQHCSAELLSELTRTLQQIPATSHLLFTSSAKPDGRLKSTKLLQKYAQFKEFSLIPPWKPELIQELVKQIAHEVNVKLTLEAVVLLATNIGSDSRLLWQELQKLQLYQPEGVINDEVVATLVNCYSQNVFELATAIRKGENAKALGLVTQLLQNNQPPIKIVATLVGQFRTWGILKLMLEQKQPESAIASALELSNPKRIYFLRPEVQGIHSTQFLEALPLLLELDMNLKRGAEPLAAMMTTTIGLCKLFG